MQRGDIAMISLLQVDFQALMNIVNIILIIPELRVEFTVGDQRIFFRRILLGTILHSNDDLIYLSRLVSF